LFSVTFNANIALLINNVAARGTKPAMSLGRGACAMIAVVVFLLCVGTLLLFLLPDDRPAAVDDRQVADERR
jgi:threonine/homoserine/homoserine lactone efflux protein